MSEALGELVHGVQTLRFLVLLSHGLLGLVSLSLYCRLWCNHNLWVQGPNISDMPQALALSMYVGGLLGGAAHYLCGLGTQPQLVSNHQIRILKDGFTY